MHKHFQENIFENSNVLFIIDEVILGKILNNLFLFFNVKYKRNSQYLPTLYSCHIQFFLVGSTNYTMMKEKSAVACNVKLKTFHLRLV